MNIRPPHRVRCGSAPADLESHWSSIVKLLKEKSGLSSQLLHFIVKEAVEAGGLLRVDDRPYEERAE